MVVVNYLLEIVHYYVFLLWFYSGYPTFQPAGASYAAAAGALPVFGVDQGTTFFVVSRVEAGLDCP